MCFGCRLDSELQNVRGSLQAQIQDLTAQLVASQQQCTGLQATAAAATACPKDRCSPTNPRALTPSQGSQMNGSVLVDPELLHVLPAHQPRPQQAAEETARASRGSSTPWQDALGLDSDSDAEHPLPPALTHRPELTRSLSSGPAHKIQPVATGKSHLMSDLDLLNVEEGAGNPPAGPQLAVTSSPMHRQVPESLQAIHRGAIVVVTEGGAVSSTSGREVGWHQGSGTRQHAVRLTGRNL